MTTRKGIMKDKFGRTIDYLRLSVVDRCNLQCLYCMPEGGANFDPWNKFLSYAQMVQLVNYFADLGIKKVRITGGEPLVRRDISELISQIRENQKIEEITLTTNGVLLEKQVKKLRKSGLNRINISLDTLKRDRFIRVAKMDRLREVLQGIDAACQENFESIKLNVVLMKDINQDEILEMVDFAIQRNIEIRFIELMMTSAEVALDPHKYFLGTQFAQLEIEKKYKLESFDNYFSSPAKVFKIVGTHTKVGFISPLSCQFCSKCNRLRLKANGMLKSCLHGKEDLNLKKLLESGLSENEIKEKIENVVYERPEKHYLNERDVQHNDFQMSHIGG